MDILHVRRHRLRAVFDVSRCQQDEGNRQNATTRAVLGMLDIEPTDRTLVSGATDTDEDYCPHCGEIL